MTFRGHIKNGQIVADSEVTLPEGTPIEYRPVARRKAVTRATVKKKAAKRRPRKPSASGSRHDRYKDLIGEAKELTGAKPRGAGSKRAVRKAKGRTLYEQMKPFIGAIKDLPPDASRNIDHYLYGHPKHS